MLSLFSKSHPKVGHIYAVLTGTYVGEMLVYIKKENDSYKFISIPKNINREVPIDKFELGLSENIIDHVQKAPTKIFTLLKKQFEFNSKNAK